MKLSGYECLNQEKLGRAINGSMGSEGALQGGVGADASEMEKLTEYDRLGGLIKNEEGYKVKTGSFYDFDAQAPRKTPEVILVLTDFNGQTIELPEGEAIPLAVKAAEKRDADATGTDAEGPKKAKGSKKAPKQDIEAEDEE